jgi:hypothetical protein
LYYIGPSAVEFLVRDYTSFPGEFAGEIFEDKMVGDLLREHQIIPSEPRLPEVFGIDFPEGGFGRPPALTPLTIDWDRLDLSA